MQNLKFSAGVTELFPINRRHQGLATLVVSVAAVRIVSAFPINRRHQGLATFLTTGLATFLSKEGFQSIGVTKDWRPPPVLMMTNPSSRFQSIGVTKDWRLVRTVEVQTSRTQFPINRRHQGLATP